MKKILFITPFSLSTNHAGIVYSRQLLEELSNSYRIDVVSFHYKGEKEYFPKGNINIIKNVEINTTSKLIGVLSVFGIFPLFAARFRWRICQYLQSQIDKDDYDYIYFDFSQTFAYASFIDHPNKILMAHDVMAQKYSRMNTYLKPWAIRSERKLLKEGKVFTFSEKDCRLIKELYDIDSLSTTFFLSKEVQEAEPSVGDYFVFFGGWSRKENYEALEWFVDEVHPLIPEEKYKIIGGGMPDALRKKIETLTSFEYLGFVDNPYPIIAKAKAEIAPLRKGAGVKVKCIDALGCGTPVIGTDVAFEGIPEEFSSFMIKADTASEFVAAISNLNLTIDDRVRFKEFFIEKYNNKKILSYINGDN